MIRTLALIACLAGAAHGIWEWDKAPAMTVKFAATITGLGSEAFIAKPIYQDNATSKGYVQFDKPTLPEGYSSLVLFCPEDDPILCCFYDDTGYIAGLNIAIDLDCVTNPGFDWVTQGYTQWEVTLSNGTLKTYWTLQQLYISAETLATDSATRVANRDSTTLLQDGGIWVTGTYQKLYNISTNVDWISGSGSIYTEQACIPWMGHHYYYNMTTSLECTDTTIFPWFPLVYSGKFIGVGYLGFYTYSTSCSTKWFESPTKDNVKMIVPNGSECFYDCVDTYGLKTSHTYFVDPAWTISCVVES